MRPGGGSRRGTGRGEREGGAGGGEREGVGDHIVPHLRWLLNG